MGIDNQPRTLQAGEVISLKDIKDIYDYIVSHSTFKVDEFVSRMQQNYGKNKPQWFAEGIECEVLTPRSGWQKGRVRICLEFCPEESIADEPFTHDLETENEHSQDTDSPLDEIRLKMQENA